MWGPESWGETGDRQYAPVTSATRKLRTRGQPGERVRTRRGEQTRKSQHHSGGPTRTKDSFRHTQGHIYGHGGPNSTSTASPRMKKAHSVTRTHTHCKERPRFFFFFPSARETHHKRSSAKVGFPNARGRRDSVAAASADKSYRRHKPFAQQGGWG